MKLTIKALVVLLALSLGSAWSADQDATAREVFLTLMQVDTPDWDVSVDSSNLGILVVVPKSWSARDTGDKLISAGKGNLICQMMMTGFGSEGRASLTTYGFTAVRFVGNGQSVSCSV